MPKDGDFHRPELLAGLRTQVVGEAVLRGPDRSQCVGLASTAVQRRREHGPSALVQRGFTHETLGIGDGCRVLTESQARRESHLLHVQPHLLESLRLDDGGRPVGEVGVRRAAPEPEGAVGGVDRPRRVVAVEVVPRR